MKIPQINGIDTARVFIPFPEAETPDKITYSCTQETLLYWCPRYKAMPNVDAKPWLVKPFYDLVGACYDIDVATVPDYRPFIQWIGYSFMHKNKQVNFADLAQYHNVLVVHDKDERDFLQLVYWFAMAGLDVRMLYGDVPTRFSAYARQQLNKGR